MDKEELLYNQIYERTKEFGRTHFIKEIMNLERENKQRANAIDECIELCKIVLNNEDKNEDLLDYASMIDRTLKQAKGMSNDE